VFSILDLLVLNVLNVAFIFYDPTICDDAFDVFVVDILPNRGI